MISRERLDKIIVHFQFPIAYLWRNSLMTSYPLRDVLSIWLDQILSLKNENGQILVVISSYFTEGQGRLWPAGHPFSLSFPWFNKIRAVNNMSIFERLKRRITAKKDLEIVEQPDGDGLAVLQRSLLSYWVTNAAPQTTHPVYGSGHNENFWYIICWPFWSVWWFCI